MGEQRPAEVVDLPSAAGSPVEVALDELERVYGFIFVRVGNRADAEDLTQQVAMKAIPRLRSGSSTASIRGYLFATARSVLAGFWALRLGISEEELHEDLAMGSRQEPASADASEQVERILAQLPSNYRDVLRLRFLRGYTLKEVARELGTTVGNVKVMQLRALRAAARTGWDE